MLAQYLCDPYKYFLGKGVYVPKKGKVEVVS